MEGPLRELVARQASRQLIGRRRELSRLQRLLETDLPRVVHVHGVPGIGKSSLLRLFAEEASAAGARVVSLDCRVIEPTGPALCVALADAVDARTAEPEELARTLSTLGDRVVVLLDTYEVFRLADRWLQHSLAPMLPSNVRVLLAGRERPSPAWTTAPGWDGVFEHLEVGPLENADALELLHRNGVGVVLARRVADRVHRHPLALRLAVAALRDRRVLPLDQRAHMDEDAVQLALEQLTETLLGDLPSRDLREAVEAAALVRRVTRPVLAGMLPKSDADALVDALRQLPIVGVAADGLHVHAAVRPALRRCLRARDPERHQAYLRKAWRELASSVAAAAPRHLWRHTADMLYLIENPVVREAFFPSGATKFSVEPADATDEDAIRAIVEAHEGRTSADILHRWFERLPSAFNVARDAERACSGLHCSFDPTDLPPEWIGDDPLTHAWQRHLNQHPLADGERALFLRRWLSSEHGERPCDVQAACWLDIKRLYMEMRPGLRRVYLAVVEFADYAPVAAELGFEALTEASVRIDGRQFNTAVLDFGPRSVDGWLADLAAAEIGVDPDGAVLDESARQLLVQGERIELTPLEFGLLRYLMHREGKAVSRESLLRDVWHSVATSASNVVDAVVASVRRKLGEEAGRLQTVKGVGYRYRDPRRGVARRA